VCPTTKEEVSVTLTDTTGAPLLRDHRAMQQVNLVHSASWDLVLAVGR
jgi:hypothetical protein